jgi:hypothetical protein
MVQLNYVFLISHIRATWPANLIHSDLLALTMCNVLSINYGRRVCVSRALTFVQFSLVRVASFLLSIINMHNATSTSMQFSRYIVYVTSTNMTTIL